MSLIVAGLLGHRTENQTAEGPLGFGIADARAPLGLGPDHPSGYRRGGGQIRGTNRKESLKLRREETGYMSRGPRKGLGMTKPCKGFLGIGENGRKPGHLNTGWLQGPLQAWTRSNSARPLRVEQHMSWTGKLLAREGPGEDSQMAGKDSPPTPRMGPSTDLTHPGNSRDMALLTQRWELKPHQPQVQPHMVFIQQAFFHYNTTADPKLALTC